MADSRSRSPQHHGRGRLRSAGIGSVERSGSDAAAIWSLTPAPVRRARGRCPRRAARPRATTAWRKDLSPPGSSATTHARRSSRVPRLKAVLEAGETEARLPSAPPAARAREAQTAVARGASQKSTRRRSPRSRRRSAAASRLVERESSRSRSRASGRDLVRRHADRRDAGPEGRQRDSSAAPRRPRLAAQAAC